MTRQERYGKYMKKSMIINVAQDIETNINYVLGFAKNQTKI